MTDRPLVVERAATPRGELVLRRDGAHYEVISNGTFLMDTRDGRSERLLASAALARHPDPQVVLIAGLGVGFSLVEALSDARVRQVEVVEIEPALIEWHGRHLADYSGAALTDDRVRLVVVDVVAHLRSTSTRYDVICLDVDNGPGWTVTAGNATLYDDAGTDLIESRLQDGGVLAIWSSAPAPAYQAVLDRHFASVQTHAIMVARGEPDIVIVAGGPRGVRQRDDDRDCS